MNEVEKMLLGASGIDPFGREQVMRDAAEKSAMSPGLRWRLPKSQSRWRLPKRPLK